MSRTIAVLYKIAVDDEDERTPEDIAQDIALAVTRSDEPLVQDILVEYLGHVEAH